MKDSHYTNPYQGTTVYFKENPGVGSGVKTIIGVALCSVNEKYDFKKGILIAKDRCDTQPYAIMNDRLNRKQRELIFRFIVEHIARVKNWQPRLRKYNKNKEITLEILNELGIEVLEEMNGEFQVAMSKEQPEHD